MKTSRRDFLKGAALGTAAVVGGGLLGCSGNSEQSAPADDGGAAVEGLPEWTHEADVVVIGLGAAGASAAYEAHEAGASVIILEKQPEDHHTPSTRMCGGVVMLVDNVEKATSYMQFCAGPQVPEALTAAWAKEAATLEDRLRTLGFDGEFNIYGHGEHTEFENSDSVTAVQLEKKLNADLLWSLLLDSVQKDGIDILWESPAARLVFRKNEDGENEIIGVHAKQGANDVFVKANKGVVLTCGGYEYNEQLRSFLPADPVYFYGNPGNTGDGVLMAQDVGAQIWHMNKMVGRGIGWCDDLGFIIGINPAPYVIVAQDGKRYMNENLEAKLNHAVYYEMIDFDTESNSYPRDPSWWIFDQRRIDAGPLTYTTMGAMGVGLYDWSMNNSAEIEKGWIVKADTVEELAGKINVDKDTLVATMDAYAKACETGVDEFGRDPESLIAYEPPYYAFMLYPGGPNTSGGPLRNENAQVINVWGNPIPRLFSAGELGQVVGNLYPAGGGDVSEAMSYGNIAGRNVAALESWS